jgi:glycosyltransferase involved in cell wall biosynthesis
MNKVVHFPYQSHFLIFGGFEVQMLSAINAINYFHSNEISIIKSDPWETNLKFDISHFWGLGFTNFDNIIWSKNKGKKIVMSVLVPFHNGFSDTIKSWFSSKIGAIKYYKQIFDKVDIFTVVSDEQKYSLSKFYNISFDKIVVIPNIINNVFFENSNKVLINQYNLPENYIISVGNICDRKNQLNTAIAALELNINAVFVGEFIDENTESSKKLLKLLKLNSQSLFHINKLSPNSLDLVSLINNSNGFVLPSYNETQPISLLEAAALNKPIVTSNRPFGYQQPFNKTILVEPNSINSIKKGIEKMVKNSYNLNIDKNDLDQFKDHSVAEKYLQVYNNLKK